LIDLYGWIDLHYLVNHVGPCLTRMKRSSLSQPRHTDPAPKGAASVTKTLIKFITTHSFIALLFCGTPSATAQNVAVPAPVPKPPVAATLPPPPVTPVNTIHDIDFQDFSYHPSCASDAMRVSTRNGEYTRRQGLDRLLFKVDKVNYGDLTDDRVDEAIVTSTCNTGGTGQFSEGFVFSMREGRAVELTKIEGGDRAFGGIADARVERGLLVVERYAPDESGGGACCPKYIETTRYRWNGRRLVLVGSPSSRSYRP